MLRTGADLLGESRDIFTPSPSHVTEEGSKETDPAAACLTPLPNGIP